jgi:hypothetical protein
LRGFSWCGAQITLSPGRQARQRDPKESRRIRSHSPLAAHDVEYQAGLDPADQFMVSAEAPPPALIERFRLDRRAPHSGAISLGRQARPIAVRGPAW